LDTKAIIFEYLAKNADRNQDLSILCLNTIQKELEKSKDYEIRLLALETLFNFNNRFARTLFIVKRVQ
jgi:vesicle coat complex subunit